MSFLCLAGQEPIDRLPELRADGRWLQPGSSKDRIQMRDGKRCAHTEQANIRRISVAFVRYDSLRSGMLYRGGGLLSAAAGPDFRTAMLHPNVNGWEKDEPADEGC